MLTFNIFLMFAKNRGKQNIPCANLATPIGSYAPHHTIYNINGVTTIFDTLITCQQNYQKQKLAYKIKCAYFIRKCKCSLSSQKYHITLLHIYVFSHISAYCSRKTAYCTIHGSANTIRLPSEIEQQNHINSLYFVIQGTGNANLSGHQHQITFPIFMGVLILRESGILLCLFCFTFVIVLLLSGIQSVHLLKSEASIIYRLSNKR